MDEIIDSIYDLFDRAMWANDEVGMTFGFKLASSMITMLDTDLVIAILSISLPVKLMEARIEFARAAYIIIELRQKGDAEKLLKGLI